MIRVVLVSSQIRRHFEKEWGKLVRFVLVPFQMEKGRVKSVRIVLVHYQLDTAGVRFEEI